MKQNLLFLFIPVKVNIVESSQLENDWFLSSFLEKNPDDVFSQLDMLETICVFTHCIIRIDIHKCVLSLRHKLRMIAPMAPG